MLLPNLYEVVNKEVDKDEAVSVTVRVNENHSVFEGHFPENPVMPGVCMLQIIKELCEQHLHTSLFLQKASQVKFTALINPNLHPQLMIHLAFNKDGETVKIKNTTTFLDGTVVLKCNAIFVERNRVHEND